MFSKLTRVAGGLIFAASTAVVVYSQLAYVHLVSGFDFIYTATPYWPAQAPQYVLQPGLTGYAFATVAALGVGALLALPQRYLEWSPTATNGRR